MVLHLWKKKTEKICTKICSSTKQTMCRTDDEHGMNCVATFVTRS